MQNVFMDLFEESFHIIFGPRIFQLLFLHCGLQLPEQGVQRVAPTHCYEFNGLHLLVLQVTRLGDVGLFSTNFVAYLQRKFRAAPAA